MNIYNLIEYSDNYSDSTASLYQFKRQEQSYDYYNLKYIINLTDNNSTSFKYKSGFLGTTETQIAANVNPNIPLAHRLWRSVQIIVPLKYISSFFRSLEMPFINTKLYIQLNYSKNSAISSGSGVGNNDSSTFKITKTELYVPVVTLNTEDNLNKLSQLLNTEFKGTVSWNEYKSKRETVIQTHNDNNYEGTLLYVAIPGVNSLFVAGFNDNGKLENNPNAEIDNSNRNRVTRNSFTKYFLPRVDIKDYNVLIDGRNFCDQNISDDF